MEQVAEAWSREMRRGYTKLTVLTILSKTPLSGYGIMKEFHARTLGFWTLTTGGVYPILQELEEHGYITGTWQSRGNRRRKLYAITDAGQHLLKAAVHKQQQIAETLTSLIREYAHEILDTQLPTNLPLPTFDLLSFLEQLAKKPHDEQMRILHHHRDRFQTIINRIDERLTQIESEQNSPSAGS